MHLRELKQKSMADLVQLAKGLNIEGAAGLRKQELIGWANRGPSAARVERVDVRWRSFVGDFSDFRIVD